jgi:hypothetical protein
MPRRNSAESAGAFEQPAKHHGPSDTGLHSMADAAREQLQVHHPDWFVI